LQRNSALEQKAVEGIRWILTTIHTESCFSIIYYSYGFNYIVSLVDVGW